MSGYIRHPTLKPFDFKAWIDAHRERLKPPVANKLVFEEAGMTVMVIGEPNRRTDFHDDPVEEFFYQLEGNMVLKVAVAGRIYDVPIRQGEVFMLPPHVRHSPQRPVPGSVGLVVESHRAGDMLDGFEWFCSACGGLVYRVEIAVGNIVTDLRRSSRHSTLMSAPAPAAPAPRSIQAASRPRAGPSCKASTSAVGCPLGLRAE